MLLEFTTIKIVFLYGIFIISAIYQVVLFFVMFKNRKNIDFLSAIKRGNRISKAGLFFFVLMLIITYQALFLDDITNGLVELMAAIILGDLGATWLGNNKKINMERIKKRKDCRIDDEEEDI